MQRDLTHCQRGICEGRSRCGEEDERYGLPSLKTDAAGVPGTADEPAAGENENGH